MRGQGSDSCAANAFGMTRVRALGATLAVFALLASGLGPASAESFPELGPRNFFEAVGSAQATFTLSQDAVLETYSWWSIQMDEVALDDDAHLRTAGKWAALIIQRVAPEQTVTVAFTSLPNSGHCAAHDPTCEPFEMDDGRWSELAPQQPNHDYAPRYLLRAGTYVVAILAEPGMRTTAALSLTGLEPSTTAEHAAEFAQREIGSIVEPHHELTEPTQATMQVSQQKQIQSTKFSGELFADVPSESRVFNLVLYNSLATEEDPGKIDVKFCFQWADLAEGGCSQRGRSSTCNCQVIGFGGQLGVWWERPVVPKGRLRWSWDLTSAAFHTRASAYLIVWPYFTAADLS